METASHSSYLPRIRHRKEAVVADAGSMILPAAARAWLTIAIIALVMAGMLSLIVVAGRIPGLQIFPADPLFYQRCLVAHVVLSLIVWFYAFIAGLASLASQRTAVVPTTAAAAGVTLIIIGAFMPGADPILANYIPVIDHPSFLTGIALFFAATLMLFGRFLSATVKPSPSNLPNDVVTGLRAAAVAVFLAAATWVAAYAGLPEGVDRLMFFEFSAWGAGHVLQVANVCAMLAVWLWLLREIQPAALPTAKVTTLLFGLLLLPHLSAPLLTLNGSLNHLYIHGSTQLMRWAIFPVVTVMIVIAVRHLWINRRNGKSPRSRALTAGLVGSIGLTTLGFIIGAMIRGSSTLIPAHYHASLGGVSIAFMTAAYLIAARRPTIPASFWPMARLQLIAFGAGQAIFVAGFAIGGLYGLGRKTYASEQFLQGPGEYVGIAIMAIGGLLAAAGGIAFLCIILREVGHWWGILGPNRKTNN